MKRADLILTVQLALIPVFSAIFTLGGALLSRHLLTPWHWALFVAATLTGYAMMAAGCVRERMMGRDLVQTIRAAIGDEPAQDETTSYPRRPPAAPSPFASAQD